MVSDSNPRRLLEKVRAANQGGDVMPLLLGGGMRLTDSVSTDAGLTFESERVLPGGSVEIVYPVAKPAAA